MKEICTKDAVGHVLCHDITQIIPGVVKDARFRKGHIVTEEDIPVLLSLGKEHLFVWENDDTMYHENEAAEILCKLCRNQYMDRSEVKEGKIELKAAIDGLFKIDMDLLNGVNSLGEMMIASRHPNTPVKKGDKLCGTRVIPLVIKKEKMEEAKRLCGDRPIFTLLPFKKKKVGIVTTGSEVYHGRIEDKFGPVLKAKAVEYGCEVIGQTFTDDNPDQTRAAILDWAAKGADMIFCSGGMSVDPDDKTPLAIRSTGARVVTYGAPVLPGAMFMLAYLDREEALAALDRPIGEGAFPRQLDGMALCGQEGEAAAFGKAEGAADRAPIPIVGLPGCVMYAKRTIFDLVLPRLAADDPVTKEEIDRLGRGGLCLNCDICTYPNCGFGKGW